MIKGLYIENIALIDEIRVEFGPGFTVLTGETGAGKSIIVDAVNLILGQRADRDLIKQGAPSAYVEAQILVDKNRPTPSVLKEMDITEPEVTLSRSLSNTGRTVCRIDGRIVSLQELRQVAAAFVDLYGQNQSQHLLSDEYHLELIDTFAGESVAAQKNAVAENFAAHAMVKKKLLELQKATQEKEKTLDFLAYRIAEIQAANLKMGEEEELSIERTLLLNAEKIATGLTQARDELRGERGALVQLFDALRSLEGIADLDERYKKIYAMLNDQYYALEEASYELVDAAEGVVYDDNRLTSIESRLETIQSLKRKYSGEVADVLAYLEEAKNTQETLLQSEEQAEALVAEESRLWHKLLDSCALLTKLRKEYAQKYVARLQEELKDLGMKDAVLLAEFMHTEPTPFGSDGVALLISVNKGVAPRRLSRIASGGEISRIMLGIKNITAKKESMSTMIFDEIDTGISGTAAQVVAKKIANISRERQVICVTHLPQIAAMGDANYFIEKKEAGGMTKTTLTKIEGKTLAEEIARLSGGIVSEAAIAHSEELLCNAAEIKKQI